LLVRDWSARGLHIAAKARHMELCMWAPALELWTQIYVGAMTRVYSLRKSHTDNSVSH
jgi:hypothetical protein